MRLERFLLLPLFVAIVTTSRNRHHHRNRHRHHPHTRHELCELVLNNRHAEIKIPALTRHYFGSEENMERHFQTFEQSHKKNYTRSGRIVALRSYALTSLFVECHNQKQRLGHTSFTVQIPPNADMIFSPGYFEEDGNTEIEFGVEESDDLEEADDTTIPSPVDWRDHGYISPIIDNQGSCDCCYAFVAAYSIAAALKRKTGGPLVRLSNQQITDCSRSFNNKGCKKGSPDRSYRYVQAKGIMTYDDYPFTKTERKCKYDAAKVKTNITDFDWATYTASPRAFLTKLARVGPLAVSMFTRTPSFHAYKGGIYYDEECQKPHLKEVDHSMLAVGFGRDSNGDYYVILKNTAGPAWGEQGYMRLRLQDATTKAFFDACKVVKWSVYPII